MKRDGRSNRAAAVQNAGRAACPHAAAVPWPKVRLGEIGRIAMCKRIMKCETSQTGDIPFFKIGTFGGTADAFISKEKFDSYKEKYSYPKKGNVLISAAGTIGRLVVFDGKPSYFQDSNIVWIEHDERELLDRYLYYFLRTHDWQITQGATIQRLYNDDIRNTEILLPPLPIQRRIASVLGAYDDLIENNRRRIALLEKMARELYRERFVRRAGKGNTVTLGEIMSITRGLSYTSREIDTEDGVNLINLKNIRSFGGFREEGTKKYSGDYKNAQVVKKGDLVMGVTDMTQDRRTVGAVALLPDLEGESVISADLIKIDSELGNCFLFCMFCYGGVSSQIGQFATGATVLHLRPQAVLDFSVTLPAREEVEAFESQIVPIFEEQGNLLSQNRSLSRQRDRLLPRLMSGKIDVEALVKEEERHG